MESGHLVFFNNKDVRNPAAGGGTALIHRLMRRLASRGHSVTLIAGGFEGCSPRESIDGVDVIRVGGTFTVYPQAIRRYLFHEARSDPNLVVDSALMGIPFFTPLYVNTSIIAVFFHLEKDVYFMEMPLEMRFAGGASFAARVAYILENRLVPSVYRDVLKITFSESTKRDMLDSGFEGEIRVLQEGTDLSLHTPGGEKSSKPLILYTGRLKKYKGVQDVLQAMDHLIKKIPDIHLSIVGRGSYEGELRRLVTQLGLEQHVTFHGFVSDEEKVGLMRKAHVLVMPSYKEGWAAPVIEANACGTVAVASDAVGVRETVVDGKTGLIYPLGDSEAMAACLETVLTDEGLRKQMERNALEWARRFDREKSEAQFVSVCEELMK